MKVEIDIGVPLITTDEVRRVRLVYLKTIL